MNIKQRSSLFLWLLNKICGILPVFFWAFLIFGFEKPEMAALTLTAALLHEVGHFGYLLLFCDFKPNIRSVLNGMKIRSDFVLSYDKEIKLYLSGVTINLLLFVIFSFAAFFLSGRLWIFALINLATALSNLLPIEGYDGYGALMAMIHKFDRLAYLETHIYRLSSFLIFLFCIFSLYLIDRHGGGYWIFAVFFVSMIKCIRKGVGE